MRCLLDTHAFLWFVGDPDRLSSQAREAIEDGKNEIYWSAASEWELLIKVSLGKIELGEGWQVAFAKERAANGIKDLPVAVPHCESLVRLPWHHRDPFDRLLVSQAMGESLALVSKDEWIQNYDVEWIW